MRLLTTILFATLCATFAIAEIVDPLSNPNALLDSLAPELDRKGIDVRRGASVGMVSPDRPHLAKLNTFPTPNIPAKEALGRFGPLFEASEN